LFYVFQQVIKKRLRLFLTQPPWWFLGWKRCVSASSQVVLQATSCMLNP